MPLLKLFKICIHSEQNPLKQGLKREWDWEVIANEWAFRTKSTKTRIETQRSNLLRRKKYGIPNKIH